MKIQTEEYLKELSKFNKIAKKCEKIQVDYMPDNGGMRLLRLGFDEMPDNTVFLEDLVADKSMNQKEPKDNISDNLQNIDKNDNINDGNRVNIGETESPVNYIENQESGSILKEKPLEQKGDMTKEDAKIEGSTVIKGNSEDISKKDTELEINLKENKEGKRKGLFGLINKARQGNPKTSVDEPIVETKNIAEDNTNNLFSQEALEILNKIDSSYKKKDGA